MTIYFANDMMVANTTVTTNVTPNGFNIPLRRENTLYAGNWRVHVTPEGKNDGKNEGGLIVRLVNGSNTQEVSRVGFIRRNSNNPDNSFERQLRLEVERAEHAAQAMNNLTSGGLA